MTFLPAQSVLWNGEACTVDRVQGAVVVLHRERDGFAVITSADVLAGHQAVAEQLARLSLLGSP